MAWGPLKYTAPPPHISIHNKIPYIYVYICECNTYFAVLCQIPGATRCVTSLLFCFFSFLAFLFQHSRPSPSSPYYNNLLVFSMRPLAILWLCNRSATVPGISNGCVQLIELPARRPKQPLLPLLPSDVCILTKPLYINSFSFGKMA